LADVDKPDSSGNTALHLAVTGGKLGIAALLIAAGADPDMENCSANREDVELSDDDDEYSSDEQTDGPLENTVDKTTTDHLERVGTTPREMAAGDDKVK